MTTTHTPGPWVVHKPRKSLRKFLDFKDSDTGIQILAELPNDDGALGGYQVVIGSVNCQPWKRVLSEANARLIAAAPDLLAALEYVFFYEGDDYSNETAYKLAKAAISKATGMILTDDLEGQPHEKAILPTDC